jgi:homoserine kinase type II
MSTMNETSCMETALRRFFPDGYWSLRTGASGMNNTTRFVERDDGTYVLRVYETHRDAEKAIYEHQVLLAIHKLELPFRTPVPVYCSDGASVVRTDDGKLAALFRYMPGRNPALHDVSSLRSFGRVTGQLTCALQRVHVEEQPMYRPYYEIDYTHPRCTPEIVAAFCNEAPAPFDVCADALHFVGEQLSAFRQQLPMLRELPHQLIHGDLNASNLLADQGGAITAVLDFEFVTQDLRVMELAVCLADFLDPDLEETLLWERAASFLEGYGSVTKLTSEEVRVVPLLVQLRRMDVFLHFLGRCLDGIDGADIVIGQIGQTHRMTIWLKAHAEKLTELVSSFVEAEIDNVRF